MTSLEVAVPCGGARHQVVLTIDRLGRVRYRFADHDADAEAVVEALGGPVSARRALRGAMARLQSAVPGAAERAEWFRLGVRGGDHLGT